MNKKSTHIAAGLAGAAVGATVGATAVAMADPKNRKKVLKTAKILKEQTVETVKKFRDQTMKLTPSAKPVKKSGLKSGNGAKKQVRRIAAGGASAL